ncbi:MAG: hypothetical protein ACRENP_10295 [Longimicrobiales bacterium]
MKHGLEEKSSVRERAIRFGKSTSLIGVLSEPPAGTERQPVGVVFLNSGILHHVGACRIHVRLARKLAAAGFCSIRFDLSGIGDSEARKDSLSFEQSAQLEVQEALDHLAASKKLQHFLLVGLCSGADMAFLVSQNDARVVGLCQLDGYAYRTPGYFLRYYAPKVFRLKPWLNLIRRKLGQASSTANGKGPEPGADYVRPEYRRRFPPKETVEAGLRTLTARGVDLLYLFSAGQGDHYNHRRQYERSFRNVDFGGRIQVEYYGDADHLFSALRHQEQVDQVIPQWAARVAQRNSVDTAEQTENVPATLNVRAARAASSANAG